MGVVFKAQHDGHGALVALKVIAAGDQASPEQLKRFQREVKIAQELDHPGIVRVLEAGEDAGYHWFAMELVQGRSLADVIREEEIDWRRAVEIVRDVADALAQAHDRGILHRDIKPSNILVGEKVTDLRCYGLAPDGYEPPSADSLAAAGGAPAPSAGLPRTAAGAPPTAPGAPPTAAGAPPTAAGSPPTAAGAPPTAAGHPPTSGR
jgi:serine/threonine protein kinase